MKISAGQYEGKYLVLDVEEFQPIEPSAYANVAGWNCAMEVDGESVWFFIDESGQVWDEENDEVGTCPKQVSVYERMERYA